MTKYARTKCNKIVKVNLEGDVFTSKYKIVGEPKDSIEELCDEFVREALYPNVVSKKPILLNLSWYLNIEDTEETKKDVIIRTLQEQYKDLKLLPKGQLNIYGAIWTEWGLKYVAKMSENGELELI